MKKKATFMKQVFIWAFALLGVVACSDDKELTDVANAPTPMRIARNSSPETRSIEEAKAIAADFMAQSMSDGANKAQAMRTQAQPSVQVITKDSLPTKFDPDKSLPFKPASDTLMYGVTYSDATIMIPADKDAPTVVAVLDLPTKSLPTLLRKNNGNNPLYELLQPFFNPDIYRLFLLSEEDLAFMEDPVDFGSGDGSDGDDGKERYLAPKIKVEWEQHYPFNKFCPNQYPAGCVAIATAQAMTLTGVPYTNTGFDLKDIAKFKNRKYQNVYPELVDPVAALIRIIGADVHMDYGPEASGAKTQTAVFNIFFLRMKMKFSTDAKDIKKTLRDYPKGIVMVSSRTTPTAANPNGEGHCYLIDGYDYRGQHDEKKAYLHVNFGWGPDLNGLFLQDLFAPRFTDNAPEQFPKKWTCYCIY